MAVLRLSTKDSHVKHLLLKSNAKGFWSLCSPRYAKQKKKRNAVREKWKEFLGESGREKPCCCTLRHGQ